MSKIVTEQEVHGISVAKGMVWHYKWKQTIVLASSICALSRLHIVWPIENASNYRPLDPNSSEA